MTKPPSLLLTDHGPIRVLTLNRPQVKNALNIELAERIHEALAEAEADDGVRVVIVTGSGSAYCGGADMGLFLAMSSGPVVEAKVVDDVPHAIRAFKKPIYAAVQGLAVGMSVTMLPFFDGVYASSQASFLLPFVRIGLVQEFGSSRMLGQRIGRDRLSEMIFTGRPVDAATAERWGLVTRVFPHDDLMDEVLALAAEILIAPFGAVLDAKRLLGVGEESSFEETLAAENEVLHRRYGGPDNAAAVAAFMARRKK